MPTFQMVVDVSVLSLKSLWALLLLTTSFVFGGFSCHLICTPLKVDFFLFVTQGFFTYSPSCCTSKHNLTCTFLMKSSKRKTLDSHSTQFSQNFTFLRTCWRDFVKSACVWNRLHGPHEQRKHWIYYCLFSWCSLSIQRKTLGTQIFADLNNRTHFQPNHIRKKGYKIILLWNFRKKLVIFFCLHLHQYLSFGEIGK